MTAIPKRETNNVINLAVVNGRLSKKAEIRYNKDGSIDKRHPNKVAGVSSEVYPFNTNEEIKSMIDLFNKRINEATDENKRQIACRNKMLFLIGINVGLRASDLVTLKWNFFFDEKLRKKIVVSDSIGGITVNLATIKIKKRVWKDFYTLQPKKTRKLKKFVKLYFNQAVKKAITDYIEEYPIDDINDYLFKSRKGDGAISEKALWKIIVDATKDAGIDKNVGSHSLRKTFGFWAWHNAEDKNKALVTLQMVFNHSDTNTTLRYIGLLNSEIEDMFNNVDLGLDYL